MSSTEIVVLVAVVVVGLLFVAAAVEASRRRRRTARLRGTFGPEYDRAVDTADRRSDAERQLADRLERHQQLELRPLPAVSRQRYLAAWDGVQSRFVDSPALALSEADALLTQLLAERGFPTDDLQTQEEMLSVEHTHLLERFRAGHAIEQASTTSAADTEQVRQAMLHFRTVFEALVSEGDREPYPGETSRSSDPRLAR